MDEDTVKRLAEIGEQDRKAAEADAEQAAQTERMADAGAKAFVVVLKRHYDALLEGGFGEGQALYLTGCFQQTCMLGQRPPA